MFLFSSRHYNKQRMKKMTVFLFIALGIGGSLIATLSVFYLVADLIDSFGRPTTSPLSFFSDMTHSESCLQHLTVSHSDLWSDEAKKQPIRITALPSPQGEIPDALQGTAVDRTPLIARSTQDGSAVANSRFFKELKFVDGTNVEAVTSADQFPVVGMLTPQGITAIPPRHLLLALLQGEIIETYWHMGSDLCLAEETDEADFYTALVTGTHTYYTNEKTVDPIRFLFQLDKQTGRMTLEPDMPSTEKE
jgi:hypothetical protein